MSGHYVFTIEWNMPSFGGKVKATVETADAESCEKVKKLITRQFEMMSSNAVVGECTPKEDS